MGITNAVEFISASPVSLGRLKRYDHSLWFIGLTQKIDRWKLRLWTKMRTSLPDKCGKMLTNKNFLSKKTLKLRKRSQIQIDRSRVKMDGHLDLAGLWGWDDPCCFAPSIQVVRIAVGVTTIVDDRPYSRDCLFHPLWPPTLNLTRNKIYLYDFLSMGICKKYLRVSALIFTY